MRDINLSNGMRRMTQMAVKGQVDIIEFGGVGEPLQVRLSGVELNEVQFSRGPAGGLVSEFPVGGDTLCVNGYEANAIRGVRPARVGESVVDFSVQNCLTEEMTSVAEVAASTEAVWILGTAGWCGACRNLMLNGDGNRGVGPPFTMASEMGPESLRLMLIMAQDNRRQPVTLRYCRQYARNYAMNAADFYIDVAGERSFPALFGHVNPYTDEEGRFGLPWNAVISGDEDELLLEYVDRSGQPERLGQVIDRLTAE